MFESPNDTSSTGVDPAVSILYAYAVIKGMHRPELNIAEMVENISDDYLDCLVGCALIPRPMAQWDMSRRFDHEASVILASELRAQKRSISQTSRIGQQRPCCFCRLL